LCHVAIAAALVSSSPRSQAAAPPQAVPLTSRNVVVIDEETGTELLAKAADEIKPIASTTKVFVALAVRKKGIDLEGWTEITRADVELAKGGARTRLDLGQTFRNRDLLRAMLMASDNRAPSALGRAVGLDAAGLVKAMNAVAVDLRLTRTKFTDPSGLRGNVSTARELALGLRAALADPELREIFATEEAEIVSKSKFARLRYRTTNQALVARKYDVLGGKTGYTRAAGYCFVTGARVRGRSVVLAVLGAPRKEVRFADFDRAIGWLGRGAPGATGAQLRGAAARKPAVRVEASGVLRSPTSARAAADARAALNRAPSRGAVGGSGRSARGREATASAAAPKTPRGAAAAAAAAGARR
jgi:serine-type D-Ala-D-Ala endopeptidase (penicillin-binding protein 7)